jgi:hypothetical protein
MTKPVRLLPAARAEFDEAVDWHEQRGPGLGPYGQTRRPPAPPEFLAAADPLGWEVLIPRSIRPAEIHRVRALPQVVGWRYLPGSQGRPPCACPYCTRGESGGDPLRTRSNSPP